MEKTYSKDKESDRNKRKAKIIKQKISAEDKLQARFNKTLKGN